jgi:hypothetical protein
LGFINIITFSLWFRTGFGSLKFGKLRLVAPIYTKAWADQASLANILDHFARLPAAVTQEVTEP